MTTRRTLGIAIALLVTATAPASASTTIGQTSPLAVPCNLRNLLFQASTAADPRYVVPEGGGLVTSWSTQAGNVIGSLRLVIVRPLGAGRYAVVAESPAADLLPNHFNTFVLSPPLAVHAGDLLGLEETAGSPACVFGPGTVGLVAAGDALLGTGTDIRPGVGYTFMPYGDVPAARLNVSATVEPVRAPDVPPTASTPGPQARPAAPAFRGVTLVSTRASWGGRSLPLHLGCPAGTAGGCSGHVELSAWPRAALGRARFSIAPGAQERVRVRVSHAGRTLLSRASRLRAKVTSVAHDGAGRSTTTVVALTIVPRHR